MRPGDRIKFHGTTLGYEQGQHYPYPWPWVKEGEVIEVRAADKQLLVEVADGTRSLITFSDLGEWPERTYNAPIFGSTGK